MPYNTASEGKTHFPAASVTLEIEGNTTAIAVGVSKHITEDMGRDIPHFRHYLKKALDVEPGNNELDTPPTSITIESGMVVTRAQQLKQDELEERELLQQKQDGPSCLLSTRSLMEVGWRKVKQRRLHPLKTEMEMRSQTR